MNDHNDYKTYSHRAPPLPPETLEQRHRREAAEFYQNLHRLAPAANPLFNVTNVIIALCVISYVAIAALGGGWLTADTQESMRVYEQYGASSSSLTPYGEWWRLLTSMFMHFGIIHLAVNMFALYQVGAFIEKLEGKFLYAVIYLASGTAGGFASLLTHNGNTLSAGASGAIFGVYGAVLGYMLSQRKTMPILVYKPIVKSTALFAIYNIGFGMAMPGIDLSAHIGGFVCGVVFGALLAQPLDLEKRTARWPGKALFSVVLLGLLIAAGIAITSPR